MLDLPDVVDADPVRQHHLLERVLQQLVVGALAGPRARILVLVEDPEAHRISLTALPRLNSVRRILIVGSTGSIGTQALDVIERGDDLELVGLAAASSWELLLEQARRPRRAPHRARGPGRRRARGRALGLRDPGRARGARRADHRHRLRPRPERARRLGGPRSDRRDAGRGHRPRARQQGEPRGRRRAGDGARRGHRRPADPGRLRALGAAAADLERAARDDRPARPDGERRPVPRAHGPRRRHARGGARPPDLGHGREDHDRLRDAHEQGPRADRGASPVRRALRADRRGGAPAVDHPRARPPERRRHARAPRLPGHARADLLRAQLPGARRRAGAGRSTSSSSAS